ncbi:MAG: NAD(P)H-hydrate dehydratase [Enterocloster bolteae]
MAGQEYGAAYLSALSAYRTGAGLVKLLTVEENRQILQERLPEAIIATYTPDQLMEGRDEFRKMIEAQMEWADVVVLGPGLGNGPYVEYLVEDILTSAFVPVIIDADGLNAIAGHPYLTSYYTENIIVTPHLGNGPAYREESDQIRRTWQPRPGVCGPSTATCVAKDAPL